MHLDKDITLEFYYKRATYVSPITGHSVDIDIKKVIEDKHSLLDVVTIVSTNGVEYFKHQLTNFRI